MKKIMALLLIVFLISIQSYCSNSDSDCPDCVDGIGCPYEDSAQLVVVAKSGANYNSVQSAIDSITDASASRQYIVWIAPGIYEERVISKPYVHLEGAGPNTTILTSDTSHLIQVDEGCTLFVDENVSIKHLSVRNVGAGENNVSVYATYSAENIELADIAVSATGGGEDNYGIYIDSNCSNVIMSDISVYSANATVYTTGIFISESTVTIYDIDVVVNVDSTSSSHYGIYNSGPIIGSTKDGTLYLYNAAINIFGNGSIHTGIYNVKSTLKVYDSIIMTEGGMDQSIGIYSKTNAELYADGCKIYEMESSGTYGCYGMANGSGTTSSVSNSIIEGVDASTHLYSGDFYIHDSQLSDGATADSGTYHCTECIDNDFTIYACP